MLNKNAWRLALIPSVYGAAVWSGLLLVANLNLIELNVSLEANLIFVYVICCFCLSALITYKLTAGFNVSEYGRTLKYGGSDTLFFVLFFLVGLFGVYKYVSDFSGMLKGESFFMTFLVEPLKIRALAAEGTSIGFQLSYFTWPAIAYCVVLLAKSSRFVPLLLCAFVLLMLANLLFIDRTRPVLLLIVSSFLYFLIRFSEIKRPFRVIAAALVGPLIIFFGFALFTNKYDATGGLVNNFLVYVIGGFGYFSVSLDEAGYGFGLSNVFLPITKLLMLFGVVESDVSEILEFKGVPFLTNVGTFLYPLLADGGWYFVVLFAPVLIVVFDWAAIYLLYSRTVIGIFIWSNIVAASLLSFFVPKYNSTYFYVFFFVYIAYVSVNAIKNGVLVAVRTRSG